MRTGARGDSLEIFGIALELTRSARAAYLDRTCSDQPELRREVESLLRSHERATGFLEPSERPAAEDTAQQRVGAELGAYRIHEMLGSGGMGAVYRATRGDGAYEQQVAIKIIHGQARNQAGIRRFLLERRTLAQLDHPNITRLIDAGSTGQGEPYLVMEYVEGLPITEHAARHALTIPQRVELFRLVCDAVHHAHTRLIIHRDLKPANVLVTAHGAPKVLDFGIAKILGDLGNAADITGSQPRPMTPRYASPEQIRGESVTTAADVYSLGVLLYELLAGVHPFHAGTGSEFDLPRRICEVDPRRPSLAAIDTTEANESLPHGGIVRRAGLRELQGDLDNIILMALQKDPARRYGSVQQLSEDLDRYLRRRPVLARPDTVRYRLSKWVRRNQAVAVVSAALILTLLVGILGTSAGLLRARSSQARAERERIAALQAQRESEVVTAFLQSLLITANPYRHGRERPVRELLADASSRIDRELAGMPAAEAAVRFAIAETYGGLWEWESAAAHLRRALTLQRQVHGRRDLRVAATLSLLGRARTFLRRGDAVDLQREALSIRREILGAQSREVAESMGNLGYALWHAGPDAAPNPHLRTAVVGSSATTAAIDPGENPDHTPGLARSPTTAPIESRENRDHKPDFVHSPAAPAADASIGRNDAQARFIEAEAHYRAALDLYDRLGIHDDPDVARFSFSLGVMLHSLNRVTEAEQLYTRALDIYDRLPVTQDCYRVRCLRHYARLLESSGRLVEWAAALQLAAELDPDTPEPGPPRTY